MSLWRQLVHGFRSLLDRHGTERDIADEVGHYFDAAVEALIASGVPPAEARRRVRRELGDEIGVREQVRSYGWENFLMAVAGDMRLGTRRLLRNPGFTALSATTLAIGIGAVTAILSVTKPLLFDPLPYPTPDRILAIYDRGSDGSRIDVTFGSYLEIEERNATFESLAVMRPWQPTLTGAREPERLDGQRVTARFFQVLGVTPALGRSFDVASDRPNGPRTVVLSNALWQSRFGGDRAIVGRRITLDGEPFDVIGVMGPDFEDVLAPTARVWTLLQYDPSLPSIDGREWGHHLGMVGRLRPGVSSALAGRDLDGVARARVDDFPRPSWATLENGLVVTALKTEVTRSARPTLLAILGAVGLLLLVSCVNLTNLLLGRGVGRRGEFAMRASLGASRSRLIQQLATESLLLATLGGVIGILLGLVGVDVLVALSPPELPRLSAVRVDGTVFLTVLGITTAVGLVIGLMPGFQATQREIARDLHAGSDRVTGGQVAARRALVVVEISLTLVLLTGAGLLLRSLQRLFANDPGFEASQLVAIQVQTSGPRFRDEGATRDFFSEALDAVRRVPGVTGAATTSQLPLSGQVDLYGVQAESDAIRDPDADRSALRYAVSPGYFQTMRIPVLEGRALGALDAAVAPRVVVISESLARRRFEGRDPIGQRLHVGRRDLPWYTVVGVVGDVKHRSLGAGPAEAAYITPDQWYFADGVTWFVVRARGDARALLPGLEEAIWSVDPDQPIVRVATMAQIVERSAADRRLALRVFEAFALAALTLAAIGLYGVLSASVAARTQEMGVRAALGASRNDLVALILRQGLILAAMGVGVGVVGAVALSRGLAGLVYDVSTLDPTTYLVAVVLLTVAAALACAVPAWRAARTDPMRALRIA